MPHELPGVLDMRPLIGIFLRRMGDRPKKILLVDDNRTYVSYIALLLRKMGFTKTIIAENGIEVLKLLRLWRPDIVVMDVNMPGLGGIETLRHMKGTAETADIPVVLVSSSPDERMYVETSALGCAGLIKKPFTAETLHGILQESLVPSGSNRREQIRISYECKVGLVVDGGKPEICYSVTLSKGGIYIRRNPPYPTGTEVEVILPIDRPMHVRGEVIYFKEVSSESLTVPPGMAVRFTGLSAEATALLDDHIKELIAFDPPQA